MNISHTASSQPKTKEKKKIAFFYSKSQHIPDCRGIRALWLGAAQCSTGSWRGNYVACWWIVAAEKEMFGIIHSSKINGQPAQAPLPLAPHKVSVNKTKRNRLRDDAKQSSCSIFGDTSWVCCYIFLHFIKPSDCVFSSYKYKWVILWPLHVQDVLVLLLFPHAQVYFPSLPL